jgi:predicted DsbA family dithiol-disulfide isomerase
MPAGGLDIHAELRKRFADLEPVFARLVAEAKSSDLDLDPKKQPFAYPTLAAHTLLRHAESRGTQRALAGSLYRAHFDEARNISDPDVLADIATHHGFTTEAARAIVTDPAELARTRSETEQAAAAGINAVPVFVIDGQRLAGAQPEAVLRAAIETALRT